VISYQLSVISDQLSVISYQLIVSSGKFGAFFSLITVYWTATPCLWQH